MSFILSRENCQHDAFPAKSVCPCLCLYIPGLCVGITCVTVYTGMSHDQKRGYYSPALSLQKLICVIKGFQRQSDTS